MRRALLRRSARVAMAIPFLFACASAKRHTDGPPLLERLIPDSVFVAPGSVVEVTLVGSGFHDGAPGENTVMFAGSTLRHVPATADGRRITFVVPDAIESGGEAPPSRLLAGTYPVQVETALGKSNILMLRVVR